METSGIPTRLESALFVYTDWVLIRRLALELREECRGTRVHAAGLHSDGRFAIALRRGNRSFTLAFDLFAPTPLVTLEDGLASLGRGFGFARAAGDALHGMTLSDVQSRDGDRLIRFLFAARSRFGIAAELALVAELVPRYGNAILLKDNVVVSALKEFSGAADGARTITAGELYEPPPLRAQAIPPLLRGLTDDPAVITDIAAAQDALAPLHVYRDAIGALVQAHVVPLPNVPERHETAPRLLPLLGEMRRQTLAKSSHDGATVRRRQLAAALALRRERATAERTALRAKLADSAQRDSLRAEGDAIFASLHAIPEAEREPQKQRAVEVFAKYRKIASSFPHVRTRIAALDETLAGLETLEWEVERARDEDIDDVAQAMSPARRTANRDPLRRKRTRLLHRSPAGSRILIGRSPLENAELTFGIARPNDLWFHVRGMPGAHVILQRDDRNVPPDQDIALAAALAAGYSKGREISKVTVDYAPRKYVRKRPRAAPGLVFYTNSRSLTVAPRRLDAES